jgi:hypothetical protein
MSKWDQHDLTQRVIEVLTDVHCNNDVHAFGRPYISAYQLAIELQRRYPSIVNEIDKPVGGAGVGRHDSLAQYVANALSRQISASGVSHPVEGAFLSNENAQSIAFVDANGQPVTSSLVGTGFDMSLFRLRSAGQGAPAE